MWRENKREIRVIVYFYLLLYQLINESRFIRRFIRRIYKEEFVVCPACS